MLDEGSNSPDLLLFAIYEGVEHRMPPIPGVFEVIDQEQTWIGPLRRPSKVFGGGGPGTQEQDTACGQGVWKAQVPLSHEWPQSQTICFW